MRRQAPDAFAQSFSGIRLATFCRTSSGRMDNRPLGAVSFLHSILRLTFRWDIYCVPVSFNIGRHRQESSPEPLRLHLAAQPCWMESMLPGCRLQPSKSSVYANSSRPSFTGRQSHRGSDDGKILGSLGNLLGRSVRAMRLPSVTRTWISNPNLRMPCLLRLCHHFAHLMLLRLRKNICTSSDLYWL